jgi:hypothetical protein
MNKKILTSITLVFVLAIACMAVLPTPVAYAMQYGNEDSADLETFWYYKPGHLNVAGMKESIASWISNADKSNPVIIGVIDTGVNAGHEVFQKTNTIFKVDDKAQGYNAFIASNNANAPIEQLVNFADGSSSTHGTAVASIMAMLIYDLGLQDYIKLYPIKASRDTTNMFPTSAVVKGLEFVKNTQDKLGMDVVNLSIAGYAETEADYKKQQQLFIDLSADCVIVAAAGNENASSTAKPCYPASLDGVVSVMAYGKDGKKTTASNFGAYDVVAPGQDIYVATGDNNGYKFEKGTSMASAFVSVVSAVVKLREQTLESGINGVMVARHILTSSKTTSISHGEYTLSKFDGFASVHNSITETYLDPTGIQITNNKGLEDGCTITRGQYNDLQFTAQLLPYAYTNPKLAEKVVWTQTEILSRPKVDGEGKETGEVEEYDGQTINLSTGAVLNYEPNLKGKYRITASYKVDGNTLEVSTTLTVVYAEYSSVAGLLKVMPVSSQEGGTIDNGFCYELDTVSFYLAGSEMLDPTVEIKWYVNGEHVHTGATYTHKAGSMGDYEITAQYGDNRIVEKAYTLEVKSGFLRPAVWISFTAVVGALVIAGIVMAVVKSKKKSAKAE